MKRLVLYLLICLFAFLPGGKGIVSADSTQIHCPFEWKICDDDTTEFWYEDRVPWNFSGTYPDFSEDSGTDWTSFGLEDAVFYCGGLATVSYYCYLPLGVDSFVFSFDLIDTLPYHPGLCLNDDWLRVKPLILVCPTIVGEADSGWYTLEKIGYFEEQEERKDSLFKDETSTPTEFALKQNYPNPFNSVTKIQFVIGGKQGSQIQTTLKIYNIQGQLVRILVNEPKSPGTYEVDWEGKDNNGKDVASGLYFYKLELGNLSQTKKMLFLK